MFWNLFVQHLHSLFTQDFVHTQKGKNLPWLEMFWWKKDWKRFMKSQIQEHWLNGFWTCFVNLIHSTYKQKHNPNHKDKKAAPESQEQICIFHTKFSKLKTYLELLSKPTIDSKGLLGLCWTCLNTFQGSIHPELVEPRCPIPKYFHIRVSWFMHCFWFLMLDLY